MSKILIFQRGIRCMMGGVLGVIAATQTSHAQLANPNPSVITEELTISGGSLSAKDGVGLDEEAKSLRQTSTINPSNIQSIAAKNSPWTLVTKASTLKTIASHNSCSPPTRTLPCVAADSNQPVTNLLDPLQFSQALPSKPDDEPRTVNKDRLPNLIPEPTPGKAPFQPERVPLLPARNQEKLPVASPGITSVTPSAYGKSWGSAGIGAGFQARTRFTDRSDGAIAAGIGFGDARKAVGLDVGVAIFNLSDSFGDRGSVSFKLHRILPDDLAVAVGWQNAIVWGSTDAGNSVYGVATKMFRLKDTTEKPFSRLYVSAGIGSGQYRSEFDINDDNETVGIFGSVALRVAEPVNAIAEWSGQDLTLGASFVPFQNLPLVITPALTDITGNAGDGARFILGIGYGFSY